jgi:hypothetical protein
LLIVHCQRIIIYTFAIVETQKIRIMMRNILKAVFIVIAILAISCDKSEDLSSKDLVGSWYLESVTYGGQPQGLSSCAKKSNIVFTETEYTKTEYAGIDGGLCSETHKKIGTYTTSGSKVLVKYKEGNNETVPTISISGKTLTLSLVKEQGDKNMPLVMTFVKR